MNKLIAIIDSGSSISKWAICDSSHKLINSFNLKGINPTSNPSSIEYFVNVPEEFKKQIKELYFYGSGVSTPESVKSIQKSVSLHFPNLERSEIKNDLLAACRAVSHDKESYVVILGTGTNACHFDGKTIGKKLPSLGYIFDDYGSGYHIGREVIKRYFYKTMDPEDTALFERLYSDNRDEIINPLYQSTKPNSIIAGYTKMLSQSSAELRARVCKHTFDRFFRNKIDPIADNKSLEINFIGSIAFHFKHELEKSCLKNGYRIGTVLKTPLDQLVKYHQNR